MTVLFFLKSYFFNGGKQSNLGNENQQKAEDLEKYTGISSANLLKKINSEENFEILDIRDQDSFLLEHIIDSQNITPEDLIKNLGSLDKNKQYYLVDNLGLTSIEQELMDIFLQSGFQKIGYLEGGIYNWTTELNPVIEFGNPKSLSNQSKVNYITSDELKKLITEEEKTLLIIDVRSGKDFAAGHLKNAINIPLDSLESRRKEVSSYKRMILYDDTGLLAFQGAVRLFDMAVLNVFALSDGLNSWKQKGFEVVK